MPPSDVYTLDTLQGKLPQWHPDDENHLYAIVDMGSNGIRFSITSLASPTTRLLKPVYASRAGISLFDALTPSPNGLLFPEETIQAVSTAVSGFRQLAIFHGVPQSHTMILATEAMRRASNGGKMLEAIANSTDGLGVQILDPAVETLFGAVMGSRSGLVAVPKGALFLDLGGGSVQMTWVDTSTDNYEIEAAMAGQSLPYGAAKLTKVLAEQTADIQAAEINTLRDGIAGIYASLCSRFPALQAIKSAYENGQTDRCTSVDVYMCGGGFRGYGSMLMHNDPISPYPIPSTNTYSVTGEQFKQPTKLRQVNDEFDGRIFGMSKRRRLQFPAIATVIDAFITVVPNIGRVTFCGGSNRQGVLLMKLPRSIRESNPLEILANVSESEKPLFDVVRQLLSSALPDEFHLSNVPTVLDTGLSPLFVRQIWGRAGHSTNSNSAFALHDAIIRDADCPGLTHLARALLALTTCARWEIDLGPCDLQLFQSLRGIADSHHKHASFWARYIGAVANVLAYVFPVLPQGADAISCAIRFNSHFSKTKSEQDKLELTIELSKTSAQGINLEKLADIIKNITKSKGEKKPYKISADAVIIS